MKLKIIAGILGVPLEVLRNRDKFYQLQLARKRARTLRRWLTAVGVLFVIATIAGVIAIEQRSEAIDQRNTAWRNQSLFLADSSHQQVLDDTELAVLLALEGLPKSEQDDRPLIPEAEDTLFWAVLSLSKPERIEKSVQAVMFDSAGGMITIDGFEIESSGENMKFEYDYAIAANSNGIVRTWKNGFEGRNIQITTKKQSFLEINIDEVNAQLESAILRWDNKAMLVAGGEDGDITFTHDVSLSSSAWHADSHLLATGTENGVVRIWGFLLYPRCF